MGNYAQRKTVKGLGNPPLLTKYQQSLKHMWFDQMHVASEVILTPDLIVWTPARVRSAKQWRGGAGKSSSDPLPLFSWHQRVVGSNCLTLLLKLDWRHR